MDAPLEFNSARPLGFAKYRGSVMDASDSGRLMALESGQGQPNMKLYNMDAMAVIQACAINLFLCIGSCRQGTGDICR